MTKRNHVTHKKLKQWDPVIYFSSHFTKQCMPSKTGRKRQRFTAQHSTRLENVYSCMAGMGGNTIMTTTLKYMMYTYLVY